MMGRLRLHCPVWTVTPLRQYLLALQAMRSPWRML